MDDPAVGGLEWHDFIDHLSRLCHCPDPCAVSVMKYLRTIIYYDSITFG